MSGTDLEMRRTTSRRERRTAVDGRRLAAAVAEVSPVARDRRGGARIDAGAVS
jgi:hypothetical protein